MATTCASLVAGADIAPIQNSDFAEWQPLFRAFIAFNGTTLPDEQYSNAFERLVAPDGDLLGLVLRIEGKMVGIAHFYTHQTAWSSGMIMHLNDLYVAPEARGRGFGRLMIEAVAAKAKQMGCIRLGWVTQHENPARKLYDQLATCEFVQYRMKF